MIKMTPTFVDLSRVPPPSRKYPLRGQRVSSANLYPFRAGSLLKSEVISNLINPKIGADLVKAMQQ